ncbi:MAG: DUF4062 domain-containing protein [Gammaproteobacteria bacterium]
MSTEFQIFISSTVEDLKSVRRKLAKALEGPGRLVRCSEDPGFPVEPGVTSHDACLAMVRRCHAFVLLVGTRFGGEYQKQGKSITWREWEEACASGLSPIILVNKKTNDLCRFVIAPERLAIRKGNPTLSENALDGILEKRLKKQLTGYHHGAALQRFVDTLRKGRQDNWKLDWNGTAMEAIDYVHQNLAVQAAAADRRREEARQMAQVANGTLAQLKDVGNHVSVLAAGLRARRIGKRDAVQGLLDLVASFRINLFGFGEADRYTLVVHELRRGRLHPIARSAHPAVRPQGRVWALGESHVGLAVQEDQFMISGDIRHTAAWVRNPTTEEEDAQNYVSVMAKPFYSASRKPSGAVTLSSGRLDHFMDLRDAAPVAFDAVVSFVNIITLQEEK